MSLRSLSRAEFKELGTLLQKIKSISQGEKIHSQLIADNHDRKTFIGNLLIQMYGNCHSIEDAKRAFDRIRARNVFSWNIMVTVYSQNDQAGLARECFEKMPERDVVAWNVLLSASAQKGHLQTVKSLFASIPERSIVSWNCMLTALCENGDFDSAKNCIERMPRWSPVPWLTLLAAYAHAGEVERAWSLFQQVPEKDVKCWNCLLTAYARAGLDNDVVHLFKLMDLDGVLLDTVTCTTMFGTCASLIDLRKGEMVHAEAMDAGIELDTVSRTALLNMYAKCGSVQDAGLVFTGTSERDLIAWNATLTAYTRSGHMEAALGLFQEMLQEGMRPSRPTFMILLSANWPVSSRASWILFSDFLCGDYEEIPSFDHYVCLIDHLGRAGLLEEAEELVTGMPFEADALCWKALLNACTIHNDTDRASRALDKVYEMDPVGTSCSYVQMCNIIRSRSRET